MTEPVFIGVDARASKTTCLVGDVRGSSVGARPAPATPTSSGSTGIGGPSRWPCTRRSPMPASPHGQACTASGSVSPARAGRRSDGDRRSHPRRARHGRDPRVPCRRPRPPRRRLPRRDRAHRRDRLSSAYGIGPDGRWHDRGRLGLPHRRRGERITSWDGSGFERSARPPTAASRRPRSPGVRWPHSGPNTIDEFRSDSIRQRPR